MGMDEPSHLLWLGDASCKVCQKALAAENGDYSKIFGVRKAKNNDKFGTLQLPCAQKADVSTDDQGENVLQGARVSCCNCKSDSHLTCSLVDPVTVPRKVIHHRRWSRPGYQCRRQEGRGRPKKVVECIPKEKGRRSARAVCQETMSCIVFVL